MQHLTLEDLARLVDEAPGELEAGHLRECSACVMELERMREQTLALAHLQMAKPPEDLWPAIDLRLRREGLVGGRAFAGGAAALRAAAAVGLFLAGSVAGGTAVALAGGGSGAAAAEPRDAAQAAALLRTAEEQYLRAVCDYAAFTADGETIDPVSRLAALEGILLTTGAALRDAPADPVINNYHLTALGLRDALMRQIEDVEGEQWY